MGRLIAWMDWPMGHRAGERSSGFWERWWLCCRLSMELGASTGGIRLCLGEGEVMRTCRDRRGHHSRWPISRLVLLSIFTIFGA